MEAGLGRMPKVPLLQRKSYVHSHTHKHVEAHIYQTAYPHTHIHTITLHTYTHTHTHTCTHTIFSFHCACIGKQTLLLKGSPSSSPQVLLSINTIRHTYTTGTHTHCKSHSTCTSISCITHKINVCSQPFFPPTASSSTHCILPPPHGLRHAFCY